MPEAVLFSQVLLLLCRTSVAGALFVSVEDVPMRRLLPVSTVMAPPEPPLLLNMAGELEDHHCRDKAWVYEEGKEEGLVRLTAARVLHACMTSS